MKNESVRTYDVVIRVSHYSTCNTPRPILCNQYEYDVIDEYKGFEQDAVDVLRNKYSGRVVGHYYVTDFVVMAITKLVYDAGREARKTGESILTGGRVHGC